MMKRMTLLMLLFASLTLVYAQDMKYSRVKIYTDEAGINNLLAKGFALDNGTMKKGVWIITELAENNLKTLDKEGYRYEVLIPDMSKYYRERSEPEMQNLNGLKKMNYPLNRDWPVPAGFELGSVGGFCSIDEMIAHLDDMIASHPDLISVKHTFDQTTWEGRQIYWVKISDNPNVDESESQVLFNGMHHAREAIGEMTQLFFMYYLLDNYATDPEVKYLVDNFEIYFVPIFNMDGYAYNIQTDPNGGGMFRKNRRDNGDGSFGVDVNRNYGYMWGYDDEGSSPYTWDETYRGPEAFSEPETQGMRDFCNAHDFKLAINYHSYANDFLYAWGWTPDPCPDDALLYAYGELMTKENGYLFGPGYTTIYPTNGGSDDWMYGEQTTKGKILSYTPEVGGNDAGFWPSPSQIIPLCQVNMWLNIKAVEVCGAYATVSDISPMIMEQTTGTFSYGIKRLGLMEGATYTVSIEPINDAISSIGDPVAYNDLQILESQNGEISYTLKGDIEQGDEIIYLLSLNNGYFTTSDTIRKVYGTPTVVFQDDGNTFTKWTSPKWNVTTVAYHSAPKSIADSPTGSYSNNDNNSMTLIQPIDLTSAVFASLNFWAKWDIEAGYDYVQVFASINNGSTWTPLAGKYTKTGNSNQAPGEPVYDGTQNDWVNEEMNLHDFLGYQIKLKFTLISDNYVTGDGFYWDDMTLSTINGVGINDPKPINPVVLIGPLPNPANDIVKFNYNVTGRNENLKLSIMNGTGQVMSEISLPGNQGSISVPIATWSEGVYYYQLRSDNNTLKTGKLVVF